MRGDLDVVADDDVIRNLLKNRVEVTGGRAYQLGQRVEETFSSACEILTLRLHGPPSSEFWLWSVTSSILNRLIVGRVRRTVSEYPRWRCVAFKRPGLLVLLEGSST